MKERSTSIPEAKSELLQFKAELRAGMVQLEEREIHVTVTLNSAQKQILKVEEQVSIIGAFSASPLIWSYTYSQKAYAITLKLLSLCFLYSSSRPQSHQEGIQKMATQVKENWEKLRKNFEKLASNVDAALNSFAYVAHIIHIIPYYFLKFYLH